MMPTKDQIEAMPGTPLTKEDIEKMQAEGQLPQGLDPSMGAPTLHRIKQGDQEILVIMIDPPPCGCVRLPNGKKKRCKKHRLERRARRRARKQKKSKESAEKASRGTKMVKDDESDRKKLVELRHAADSESDEDKAIDGAITPDKVCAVGPAGVAVLVEVDKVETAEVGPRAKMEKQTIKGILIKGAHETPQFIPMEKVQTDKDGKIKYRYYTMGQLVKGKHGEAIFYADGQCSCDCHGNPQNMTVAGVDEALQKKLGEQLCVPCEVEVNEKGMVTVKYIACAEDVPKDKYAAVGVINKNTDGHVVFTQTAGQRIGSSDNAPVVVCTPNDKVEPGTVIGIVYEDKEGKTQVLPKDAKAPADQKAVGAMLLGEYRQPVFVKDVKQSQCQKAQNMQIIIIMERDVKANQTTIDKADLVVQSKVQQKTQQEILTEKAEIKNAQPIKQEVWSTSLAPGGMQGAGGGGGGYARSVFVKQGMEPGGAGGSQTYTKTVTTTTYSSSGGAATSGGEAAGGQAYSKTVTTTSGAGGADAAGGQTYSKTVTTTSGAGGADAAGGQAYSKTATTTSGAGGAGAAEGQTYSKTLTTTSGAGGAGAAGGQAYSKTATTTSGAGGTGAAGGQTYSKTVTTTSGAGGAGATGGQTYSKTVTTTTTTTSYTSGAAGGGSQAGGLVVMVPPAGGCPAHGQAQAQSTHTHTQTQTTHTHTHTGTGQKLHMCACLRGKEGAVAQGQQVKSGGVASSIGGAGTSGAGVGGAGAGKSGAGASGAGGAGAGGAGAGAGSAYGGAGSGTMSSGTGAGASGYSSGGAGGAGAGGAGGGKSSGGGYIGDAVSVYAGVIKVGTPGSVPWEHPPPKNADPGAHSVFVTRK